jgi:hypothetical protein
MVGPLETFGAYTFISIDGVYSVVIPRSVVPASDLERFSEAVDEYRKAAA